MAYADEVLADSPRLYWKLDETAGTTANDSSASGTLDGTYSGSYILNETVAPNGDPACRIVGNALTSKVEVAYASYTPSAITIEAWVRPYTLYDYSFYVNDWDTQGMMYSTALGGFGGGEWYDRRGAAANNPLKGWRFDNHGMTRDILRLGEWHHMVYTNGAGVARLYRNGKQINYVPFNAPVIKASTTFSVKWGDIGLAHVAQYDSALSATRVREHYEAMVPPPGGSGLIYVGAVAAEDYGGDMTWPFPPGTVAGDLVVIFRVSNNNGEQLNFTADGLTNSAAFTNTSRSWSAAHGTVTSTHITNGGLKPKKASDGTSTPTGSVYNAYAMCVYRNANVVTALSGSDNAVTSNDFGQRAVIMLAAVGSDDINDGRNKSTASLLDLAAATPSGLQSIAIAWEGPITRNASVQGSTATAWTPNTGSTPSYAGIGTFLIGPTTPVGPPAAVRPDKRVRKANNAGAMINAGRG